MRKKKPMVRAITRRPERTVDEAIEILWKVIDEAKMHLEAEMTTAEEKRSWAKVLCDTIGVFNKLQASRGERPLEDEDLGSLLVKVPKTMRRTIVREVSKWRRKRSFVA